MRYIPIRMEILSPVHIGTGREMDALEYTIQPDPETRRSYLWAWDLDAWIADQLDPVGLAQQFATSTIPSLRGMLEEKVDYRAYLLWRCEVMSSKVVEDYQQKLKDPSSLASLLVAPLPRTPATHAPYIPGSSIKGAIITAVIDYFEENQRLGLVEAWRSRRRKGYEDRLRELLGGPPDKKKPFNYHSMRLLKVSDFCLKLESTVVVEAKERRLNSREGTPKSPCEVVPGIGMNKAVRVYGRVWMGGMVRGERGAEMIEGLKIERNRFNKSWKWEELAEVVTEFYRKRFSYEWDKFYSKWQEVKDATEELNRAIKNINPDRGEMLLRLGHYSHVECTTITAANRHGSTRTLAKGRYPFGWVKLVPCGEEEYEKGLEKLKAENDKVLQKYETWRKEAKEKKLRLQEELRAAEQRRKEEEEARRAQEKALAKLPEYERLMREISEGIKRVDRPDLELLRLIKGENCAEGEKVPPEKRKEVAEFLKAYWEKEGLWDKKKGGKKIKPKQRARVEELKKILEGD